MSISSYRKIKDGFIDLEKAKENNNNKKKSNLNETTTGKWEHKSEEQKTQMILKCFTKQGKKLAHCLMIILQLYVRPNMKQNMKKDSKH